MNGSSCITEVFTESAELALAGAPVAGVAAGADGGSSPANGMSTLRGSFESFAGGLPVGAGSGAAEAVLAPGSGGAGATAGATPPDAVDPSPAS